MSDVMTKEQRSRNMQRIKSKDTEIEMILRKKLWEKGYRYRKNYKKLPGSPDIVLTKYKIAIFCDGEFFHGADWMEKEKKIEAGSNGKFWVEKIKRNIERDNENDKKLVTMGWKVLRFWGNEIKTNTDECIKTIEEVIFLNKLGDDMTSFEELDVEE